MFEEIKNKVKKIIKDRNVEEINNNTDSKNIGIYMIYIDNLNDDKVIPIYIGQTGYGKNRNFQNRYKEHLQEIMALNRLEYNYYKELLLDNFYDGHYKSCKIFQYMVDHNCTLKDFRMIVLEKIDGNSDNIQELLDKKEQKYFTEFLPAFFGFNQVNTVVEANKEFFANFNNLEGFVASDKLLNYELDDCENFIKYFGYGYTKFNYYHCYPKTYTVGENSKKIEYELRDKKELLKNKYYDENKFKKYNDKLPKLEKKYEKNNEELQQNKKIFEERYEPEIKEYCQKYKIGIIQKYQDIVDVLIYQDKENIIDLKKYLKRKKIDVNILENFNKDNEFTNWREKHISLLRKNNELKDEIRNCRLVKRTDDLMRILPRKEYDAFPLKDKYQEIEFNRLDNNELVINLDFSNNGICNDWWCFSYNLIKMDYKLNINNKIIEKKNIFILPQNNEGNNEIKYFEKDRVETFKLKKSPFCVRNFPDYISTTMEVQNGINEFTLMNKTKYDFKEILDEINSFIDAKTRVRVEVRNRMKNKCKEFIECNYKTDNLLKYKIIQFFNRKR
jgi:hypothetical protein